MMNIVLTGGTGFVGQKLVDYLLKHTNDSLRLAVRQNPARKFDQRVSLSLIADISGTENWYDTLVDCKVIIHAAARVHVMDKHADNSLAAYRETNVDGTLNLARQAANQGVKRFIYLSSIKVNGEYTPIDQPFRADDVAMPQCPYSISKYEAEQGLLALAKETGLEVVILRPVLVYGPGVKGNFKHMMAWLQKGIPLPLGLIKNKRSFVSVDNLADLITTCITHPRAANQIFLVSDGVDLSTTELLKKIRTVFAKPVLLLPIPVWVLNSIAKLLGKQIIINRLCGSLQVDINKAYDLLGWKPKFTIDNVLLTTAKEYINNN